MSTERAILRMMPEGLTFAGSHHTQRSKEKIRQALLGRPKPREVVEKRMTTWGLIKPLILRGGVNREVAEVIGFTYRRVKRSVNRRRPDWNSVPKYTKEQLRERKRKSSTPGQPRKLIDRHPLSEEDQKVNAIASCLVKRGFFTDDLTYHDKLKKLYSQNNRQLPENFAILLCGEYFLAARIEVQRDNKRNMIEEYAKLLQELRGVNQSLCPEPLALEQRFIIGMV